MKLAKIPSTSKISKLFDTADVLWIHWAFTKSCLDRHMSPYSMAGFGFWLPLKTLGIPKAVGSSTREAPNPNAPAGSVVPTCGELEECPKNMKELNQWLSTKKRNVAWLTANCSYGTIKKVYAFKCTTMRKVGEWYGWLKHRKNSILGAEFIHTYLDQPKCGKGFCAIFPFVGSIGNCQANHGLEFRAIGETFLCHKS